MGARGGESGQQAAMDEAAQRYLLLIALVFLVLLLRLFFLQVVQHRGHYKASLDNVLRSVTIAPPRGSILDRAGQPLAVSKQNYGLLFVPPEDLPRYMPSPEQRRLLRITNRTYHYLRLPPPDQLTKNGPAAGLLKEVDELLEHCPEPEQIERQFEEQIANTYGPFIEPVPVYSVNFARLLETTGRLRAQQRFAPRFAAYIAEQGLTAAFDEDSAALERHHLPAVSGGNVAADLPAAAAAQHALIQDQYRLARWYIRQAQVLAAGDAAQPLADIAGMARFLKADYAELMRRLDSFRAKVYGYEPLLIADSLAPDQWLYIAEHPEQFEHFIVEQYSFNREYPLGSAATHLLGYTGAASQSQIESGYDIRERSGKSGIESQYEEKLRGRLGRRDVEINRSGIYVAETAVTPPARGTDLYLTIDAGLQRKAYELLGGKRGAIIVSALTPEARGEVLALVSGPSYDATRLREPDYYRALQANAWKPELNRAIGLGFPPGSTFKMVTMSAALQTGAITPGTGWYCSGKKKIGRVGHEIVFHCHERVAGHGSVNIYEAMSESCDVAFYEMALKIPDAPSLIRQFGLDYGYGALTGIDLPGEVKGTLPDAEWKFNALAWTKRRSEQLWYDGDTMNYAIGQGFLLVTPLQVLQSVNCIAWDGAQYPPRLLAATAGQHGIQRELLPQAAETPLDKDVLAIVRAGMRKAVLDGTCRTMNKHAPGLLAKTGTAETQKGRPDHSWVVGYYPQDEPRYSFVCFFEYGGKGGEAAVPAARNLLDYLQKHDPLGRNPNQRPSAALSAALN